MRQIDSKILHESLGKIDVPVSFVDLSVASSLTELSRILGGILCNVGPDFEVQDPSGRYSYGFVLHPGITFARESSIFSDGNVLYFAHDGGGSILLVSEYLDGKVCSWSHPEEDIEAVPYHDLNSPNLRYWDMEFIEWIRAYESIGSYIFDKSKSILDD